MQEKGLMAYDRWRDGEEGIRHGVACKARWMSRSIEQTGSEVILNLDLPIAAD